jgi:hypothetical protein
MAYAKRIHRVWTTQKHSLSFQCLFQHMELLVEFTDSLPLSRNFAHRMQHRGVVATAKQFTDFGQAFFA